MVVVRGEERHPSCQDGTAKRQKHHENAIETTLRYAVHSGVSPETETRAGQRRRFPCWKYFAYASPAPVEPATVKPVVPSLAFCTRRRNSKENRERLDNCSQVFRAFEMWKGRGRAFSELEGKSPRRHDDKISSVTDALYKWMPARRTGLMVLGALGVLWFFCTTLLAPHSRFVVVLASNQQGGGVMGWKGPQEWAVEKTSIKNKKDYTNRWSYGLEVKDMSMRKKYAHEWRESWEKVDIIKETMRANPHAEWFWWLDLSTFIMEPSISLERHLFNDLEENVYRNLSTGFNPLRISDDIPYISYDEDINMVIPQDCGGFNLGSFFIRRSEWTERLLDIWWDPIFYEQKHMEWDHKEQDAFENLYRSQAWIRGGTAFVGNRKINSYPPGACNEFANDKSFFYADRDFCVNMAGCQYGRNCYDEMNTYKELSDKLNSKRFWLF